MGGLWAVRRASRTPRPGGLRPPVLPGRLRSGPLPPPPCARGACCCAELALYCCRRGGGGAGSPAQHEPAWRAPRCCRCAPVLPPEGQTDLRAPLRLPIRAKQLAPATTLLGWFAWDSPPRNRSPSPGAPSPAPGPNKRASAEAPYYLRPICRTPGPLEPECAVATAVSASSALRALCCAHLALKAA